MFDSMAMLATQATPKSGFSIMSMVLMMVGWLAIFYFILILPNKKKTKKHQSLIESLKVGDTVITIGGIKAEIASINDQYLELKVDKKGNRLTIKKSAISHKVD